MSSKNKTIFSILLLMVVYFSFYHMIWAVPLFDLDEGAFSQATLEMFYRDDFLMTYLNGQPRYDKPILVYWLQALSLHAFGVNEFAFRFPSTVASTVWVAILFDFMRRICSLKHAYLAAILMASALSITIIGKAATADAVLNACIAGTMLWLWCYLETQQSKWLYFAAIAMGIGFLTKGPIAVVIPAVVSFIYLMSLKQWKAWFALLLKWKAWLLFIAIALPWYIAVSLRDGPAFLIHFLIDHNLNRADVAKEGHYGQWWYYIVVVTVGTLPATTLLFRSAINIKFFWNNHLTRWCLIWFIFVFLLFTAVATKLPHYIVYGYTGLYVLMTIVLLNQPERKQDRWLFLPALIFFGILLLLPSILHMIQFRREFERKQIAALQFGFDYYLVVSIAFVIVLFLMFDKKWDVGFKISIVSLCFLGILLSQVAPQVGNIRQMPIKEAAMIAKEYPHVPKVMWELTTPSFSVYTGEVTEKKAPAAGELVFTKSSALENLALPYQVLYEKLGYALICLPSERLDCQKNP